MILTNCAACAAPLAHNAPRCVRCHTRYCNATCQQQAFYEPARPDRYHTQYVTRSDGAAFTFKETSANIPATPRQLHRSESSFRRAPVSPEPDRQSEFLNRR